MRASPLLRRQLTPEEAARRANLVLGGAERLRLELERHGIHSDVRQGSGVALVSAGRDLDIWVEWGPHGLRYRWWTGRIVQRTGRYLYMMSPAHAVEAAARLIAARFRELRLASSMPQMDDQRTAGTRPYQLGGGRR